MRLTPLPVLLWPDRLVSGKAFQDAGTAQLHGIPRWLVCFPSNVTLQPQSGHLPNTQTQYPSLSSVFLSVFSSVCIQPFRFWFRGAIIQIQSTEQSKPRAFSSLPSCFLQPVLPFAVCRLQIQFKLHHLAVDGEARICIFTKASIWESRWRLTWCIPTKMATGYHMLLYLYGHMSAGDLTSGDPKTRTANQC